MRRKQVVTLIVTAVLFLYLLYKIRSEAATVQAGIMKLNPLLFFIAVLMGVVSYLFYTLLWYVLVRGVAETSYGEVLKVNLAGTYLAFSLNAAVGNIVKAKFLGTDYFKVLGATVLATTLELTVGGVMVMGLNADMSVLPFVLFLLGGVVFDGVYYRVLSFPINRLKWEGVKRSAQSFYYGWSAVKSRTRNLALAFFVAFLLVISNSITLLLVGRSFGAYFPFHSAVTAIIYSEVLGGLLGTPGGVGANEVGLMLGIGRSGLAALTAITYKFIGQYAYALVGAVTFYRLVGRGKEG
ncbi:lysylphosphatidylglycerol synthase domain-containing protein [Thermococcus sp.]|uniref:lysylphosphatidylglycerol synthase domain-containing protein n=1 Tax=Thermococcus sp. TaxID=35749 RepID=UPI0025F3D827|nr:lysylphosphatidylglycerol synthase domain-containing protein [Thermococcus sp.]